MHGLGGERLGEYRFNFNAGGTALSVDLVSGNTWLGGKLLREGDWAGGAGCQGVGAGYCPIDVA